MPTYKKKVGKHNKSLKKRGGGCGGSKKKYRKNKINKKYKTYNKRGGLMGFKSWGLIKDTEAVAKAKANAAKKINDDIDNEKMLKQKKERKTTNFKNKIVLLNKLIIAIDDINEQQYFEKISKKTNISFSKDNLNTLLQNLNSSNENDISDEILKENINELMLLYKIICQKIPQIKQTIDTNSEEIILKTKIVNENLNSEDNEKNSIENIKIKIIDYYINLSTNYYNATKKNINDELKYCEEYNSTFKGKLSDSIKTWLIYITNLKNNESIVIGKPYLHYLNFIEEKEINDRSELLLPGKYDDLRNDKTSILKMCYKES
jgi:hypothetical protein